MAVHAAAVADADGRTEISFVDNAGRLIERFEIGSTLFVQAGGLEPYRLYEFRLRIGDREAEAPSRSQAVSFARTTADGQGDAAPLALWYQSGVVDASWAVGRRDGEEEARGRPSSLVFASFDEARQTLRDKYATVTVHMVERDETGKKTPLELKVDDAAASGTILVVERTSPLLYGSNSLGLLVNGLEFGQEDFYVSGENFQPGERIIVLVSPHQQFWHLGDRLDDVTGPGAQPDPAMARVDQRGRFHVKGWDRQTQRAGVYDILVHRPDAARFLPGHTSPGDIASYHREPGLILYRMDSGIGYRPEILGRDVANGSGFQFTKGLVPGQPAVGWLAPVTPSPKSLRAPYAAFHVIRHDGDDWRQPAELQDVSGGVEIHPLKSGCAGTCPLVVWNPPLPRGRFALVVDFGGEPGDDEPFVPDGAYDPASDFLDGPDHAGFLVADDPYTLGPHPVGRAEYSRDDFFPRFGRARQVDLRGIVCYPATEAGDHALPAPGKHPLFIMQHGNHRICERDGYSHADCPQRTPNHKGYMRLLELLASHGIIAVSIDAYDLSGNVPGWIEERGGLILAHLQLWSRLNDPRSNPQYPDFFDGRFEGHVDMSRISLSGHSRGGEAVVAAYLQNTEFRIGSISSIAPVDFLQLVLPDVPYFVILPAADGDVTDLHGARIYDRAGGRGDDISKSGIYIYGANHNFFNSVWAGHHDEAPPDRPDYIPPAQQQRLGDAYLASFARIHLNGEDVYQNMLRGKLVFPSTAGYKIYHFHHDQQHRKLEDGSGRLASILNVGNQRQVVPSVHATRALRLSWHGGGELVYELPPGRRDLSKFEAISFRVAQTNAPFNPRDRQDFQVSLVSGDRAPAVYAGHYDQIPPPYPHPWLREPHNVLTTVRIPLRSFLLGESGVTLGEVDTIRFRFTNPPQGEIYVVDIELSR